MVPLMAAPRQDSPKARARLSFHAALLAAGVAFVIVLALDRLFHPVLFARHPDRVLKECGEAALIMFGMFLLVRGVKKPWND
jgi:uncharacterized membrane protein